MAEQHNYRQKAIEEYGEECWGCGTGDEIVVHHRNGDRSNNRLANLVPLCSTCHGKVHGRSDELAELVRELGYEPRSEGTTSIQISEQLADVLFDMKNRRESYEDVIWRLIETVESCEEEGDG